MAAANLAYYKPSAGNVVAQSGGTKWTASITNPGTTKTCTMSANSGTSDEGTPTCS